MRAICFSCGKKIMVCRENSTAMGTYRFREHGPVFNRCPVGHRRYFLHELAMVPYEDIAGNDRKSGKDRASRRTP